ncbi:MAG: polysaccharide pyruvyl transferase family protein [Clostridia bacterium]|nr:polysaccharide pyruvyl transferase family protein [Clostridia bacterium]
MSEKKKIGMLTFSYSSNPGSVLQTYALQDTISNMEGYTASIINYQKIQAGKPIIGETIFTKPIKRWTVKKVAEWVARMVAYPLRMSKYEKFFGEYYKNFNPKRITREDLPSIEMEYDKFVVGSDQVWNYDSPNVDDTHFLDFVSDSSKKISYAASFGKNGVPEEKKEDAKKYISDFASISVREEVGVEIVSDLTDKKAEFVLDPSLLLDKERYQQMAIKPRKKKYVFLYLREESPQLEKFAKDLAKCYGLTVVKVIKHWMCNKQGKGFYAIGPRQWIGFMENADFVVTNSFHGICFSLIFEREFYINLLKDSKIVTNSRLQGILAQFGLKKRGIDEIEDLTDLDKIDYEKVNELKAKRKEHSLKFLKEALEK